MATLDGSVYVIGGYRTASFAQVSDVYRYDPAADVWTRLTNLPSSRGAAAAAAIDGKIYVAGGESHDYHIEGVLRDVEVFDPALNDWYRLPAMPTVRHGVNVAAYNGKLFVVGGHLVFAGGGGHPLDAPNNEVFEFAGGAARTN